MRARRIMLGSAAALALAAAAPMGEAVAQKSADTLRVSIERPIDVIDPYYSGMGEVLIALGQLAFDTLIYRDPDTYEYEGLLATSWEWRDDLTLDLQLRQGVLWHDGLPFTADDVVYTVNYLVDPEHRIFHPEWFEWMASAEKLGEHAVRIHLKAPFGPAIEYLSGLMPIMPVDFFGPNGEAAYNGRLVGTGPYRITEFVPARVVRLERFADYYADSPKGQPAIGKIDYRSLPDTSTQMAEMLSGGLDWLWKIAPDYAEQLASVPTLEVIESPVMRINFMGFDIEGRTGPNPFQDARVRRAATMAIDRRAMADAVIGSGATVLHTACYESQFGCLHESEVPQLSYDPAAAKALLAEAGYADGFRTTLVVSREARRVWGEIVQAYLRDVGIAVDVIVAPTVKVFYEALDEGRAGLWIASYGSYNINDVHQILPLFFAGGTRDTAGDPELKEWLTEAGNISDQERREEIYHRAVRKIAEESYWAPLFAESMTYVFTQDLDFRPWPDENPRFYLARWKD